MTPGTEPPTAEGLRTGGLIVSRLEYIQAQELVRSVHDIAGRRIALVMDQWEESHDLELQRNAFHDFLREAEQWPDCHILSFGDRDRSARSSSRARGGQPTRVSVSWISGKAPMVPTG
jgi:hypothetical protein